MPIQQINGLPPLPFPAIPTAYDESLSFMELVTKLWNSMAEIITAVNANTAQINSILTQLENLPSAQDYQNLSDALTAEIANRQAADTLVQTTLTALINNIALNYVSTEDLETEYIIGGVTFEIMTQAEYDVLTEYTPKRVYFVMTDAEHIVIKFGGATVGTATIAGDFISTMKNANRGGVIPFTPDE